MKIEELQVLKNGLEKFYPRIQKGNVDLCQKGVIAVIDCFKMRFIHENGHKKLSDLVAQEQVWRKSYNEMPDFVPAGIMLAKILLESNNFLKAREILNEVLKREEIYLAMADAAIQYLQCLPEGDDFKKTEGALKLESQKVIFSQTIVEIKELVIVVEKKEKQFEREQENWIETFGEILDKIKTQLQTQQFQAAFASIIDGLSKLQKIYDDVVREDAAELNNSLLGIRAKLHFYYGALLRHAYIKSGQKPADSILAKACVKILAKLGLRKPALGLEEQRKLDEIEDKMLRERVRDELYDEYGFAKTSGFDESMRSKLFELYSEQFMKYQELASYLAEEERNKYNILYACMSDKDSELSQARMLDGVQEEKHSVECAITTENLQDVCKWLDENNERLHASISNGKKLQDHVLNTGIIGPLIMHSNMKLLDWFSCGWLSALSDFFGASHNLTESVVCAAPETIEAFNATSSAALTGTGVCELVCTSKATNWALPFLTKGYLDAMKLSVAGNTAHFLMSGKLKLAERLGLSSDETGLGL